VFESRGAELVIHEPAFLAWYLGLSGRGQDRWLPVTDSARLSQVEFTNGRGNKMSEHVDESKRRRVVLMDPRPVSKSETRTRLAARALNNAAAERELALRGGPGAVGQLEDAQRLEAVAAALMKPTGTPTVKCGEVVLVSGDSGPSREIADTLRDPDAVAIEASVTRTDLLLSAQTDIVALAVDAAASAKANSLEKMLAHQLALIHVLAMKTGARALDFEKRQGEYGRAQPNMCPRRPIWCRLPIPLS
jgi:hypothetical protein